MAKEKPAWAQMMSINNESSGQEEEMQQSILEMNPVEENGTPKTAEGVQSMERKEKPRNSRINRTWPKGEECRQAIFWCPLTVKNKVYAISKKENVPMGQLLLQAIEKAVSAYEKKNGIVEPLSREKTRQIF